MACSCTLHCNHKKKSVKKQCKVHQSCVSYMLKHEQCARTLVSFYAAWLCNTSGAVALAVAAAIPSFQVTDYSITVEVNLSA